jgi:hypothetical protein
VLRFGAGRLATSLAAHGARTIATFAISDVIGDDPSVIGSGPCSPDPLDDATFLALLDAHDMRSRLQLSMAQVLGLAGRGAPPAVASATHDAFSRVHYTLVARNADAVNALADAARREGIMSEHYAGSCQPGQHCCLCAEDELKKRLAAAEACCAELSSRVHEVDAARTERIVELELRLAAAKDLHEALSDESDKWVRELGELQAQLAAAEARMLVALDRVDKLEDQVSEYRRKEVMGSAGGTT